MWRGGHFNNGCYTEQVQKVWSALSLRFGEPSDLSIMNVLDIVFNVFALNQATCRVGGKAPPEDARAGCSGLSHISRTSETLLESPATETQVRQEYLLLFYFVYRTFHVLCPGIGLDPLKWVPVANNTASWTTEHRFLFQEWSFSQQFRVIGCGHAKWGNNPAFRKCRWLSFRILRLVPL